MAQREAQAFSFYWIHWLHFRLHELQDGHHIYIPNGPVRVKVR